MKERKAFITVEKFNVIAKFLYDFNQSQIWNKPGDTDFSANFCFDKEFFMYRNFASILD